jgi:hypothetical protein
MALDGCADPQDQPLRPGHHAEEHLVRRRHARADPDVPGLARHDLVADRLAAAGEAARDPCGSVEIDEHQRPAGPGVEPLDRPDGIDPAALEGERRETRNARLGRCDLEESEAEVSRCELAAQISIGAVEIEFERAARTRDRPHERAGRGRAVKIPYDVGKEQPIAPGRRRPGDLEGERDHPVGMMRRARAPAEQRERGKRDRPDRRRPIAAAASRAGSRVRRGQMRRRQARPGRRAGTRSVAD